MSNTETKEERANRLREQLARGRETRRKNREAAARGETVQPLDLPVRPTKKPRNLDKIVREILSDDSLVDKVIANQPEYWGKLPAKNGGYILATVMMVKAMGGDIKAADWIRKTGFGDKVLLESDTGFFQKSDFTIQVLPSKHKELDINAVEVLDNEIKQIDKTGSSNTKPN